jgi:hypothetical protein
MLIFFHGSLYLYSAEEDTPILISLSGSDSVNRAFRFVITTLPSHGTLYQSSSSSMGAAITATGTQVDDSSGNLFYQVWFVFFSATLPCVQSFRSCPSFILRGI